MEERSAGAVVFSGDEPGRRRFLLLLNGGKWDFSKGNIEKGESELQTVLREVEEETGLTRISVIPGFRRVIEYRYRRGGRNVNKQVVYLLASTTESAVRISQEHQGFGWFPYPDALQRASYDNSKATLREAEEFIRRMSATNDRNQN
jgi:8-oxo-dGTP pyrophosphatase MutT (NUDIX family)